MSNEPSSTLISKSNRVPEREIDVLAWLESGWILEDPSHASSSPETDCFVIGGGARETLDFSGFESARCAVWAPDFFPNDIPPFSSAWSRRVSRAELLNWLSENFPGSTTSSKVHWTPPLKTSFEKAFRKIETAFREDSVKKAVPAIFATGVTATSDRRAWLAHRLRAGLAGTATNRLRLYGLWNDDRGFLGATPEALFTREGSVVSSMAVAGTRAAQPDGLDDDLIANLIREFERDPKERNEHELVVRDIASVFEAAGVSVTRSKTRVEKFGALFHLVTDFTADAASGSSRTIADWVRAFHPTPALGTSPRDPSFKLLRETHELVSGEAPNVIARENFGAPFVVKHGDRVDALVAIRQIRWKSEGDRVSLVLGSGCGVVPESDLEREWSELVAKRGAVMRLFRLSPEQSRPVFWSLEILEKLLRAGVRRFVVCAGARNAPVVVAAEALRSASVDLPEKITVESFFEERAAAFYALGLARVSGEPVAVITTSGTAVSELLPAMTEADFSGVPLIAVTADRPRRLRLSGAPQSIPQDHLFAAFVERAWDLEEGDAFEGIGHAVGLRPLHVNVCLEEPLLADAEKSPALLADAARSAVSNLAPKRVSVTDANPTADHAISLAALGSKLGAKRLLAIVGGVAADEREAVAQFLMGHAIPCLLEGPSGLRGDSRLRNLEFRSGDRYLQKWCLSGAVEHVIRLGGVPTTRVWRDLDDALTKTQTLSISKLRFSGLGRGQFIHLPGVGELADFLKGATPSKPKTANEIQLAWLGEDRSATGKLETVLAQRTLSEPGFVRKLSGLIPKDAITYVGNSLPIRWWDLAASRESTAVVEANRGVNGIDGQLSTAFGLAAGSSKELWILVGDLTALYDLAAPWALVNGQLSQMKNKVRVVILNNSGGRIFKRVLAKAPGGSAPFENEHDLEFKNWAAMWNLGYARVMNHAELDAELAPNSKLPDRSVIEIIPSSEETAKFWSELP